MPELSDITVITACAASRADHLAGAGRSVRDQGPGARWIVSIDGEHPDRAALEPALTDASEVIWLDGQYGVSVARNLALAATDTQFFRNLDADDILLPGALHRDVTILHGRDVSWHASRAEDFYDDGTMKEFPATVPEGLIPAKDRAFLAAGARWENGIHYATLAGRTEHALAVGGYRASRNGEDFLMVMAMTERWNGFYSHTVSLGYRKWANQVTADTERNTLCVPFREAVISATLANL